MTSAAETVGLSAPGVPAPAIARLSEMPSVNLTPPEIAERAAMRRLQGGLAVAVAASLVLVGGLYFQAHQSVSHARTGLSTEQSDVSVVQSRVNRLAPVAAVYTQVSNAKSLVADALGAQILWSGKLNDLGLSIPPNVWLSNLSVGLTSSSSSSSGAVLPSGLATVTFQGTALSRADVAKFLQSLGEEKGYVYPYASSTAESADGGTTVITFTTTVIVTRAALSGHYTNQSGS